ncbi:hypothetical protein AWB68_07998 [Caballeronia choica]|jgi:hypothetical protein|uniref:Uncharacterized protein n=1 Tax=Caballeronia choica TaxID=326476 RepID=A0A158L053_9BURK|nr:hypothetical protein [Caballeronia choica]SAL86353.1 hypothetical protein AWB68_07998 [Caballeronia choica]
MNQIMISCATYAKLSRVTNLTDLDPQQWADMILEQMADELIEAAEKPDALNGGKSAGHPDREPTEDESTGLQWWNRLQEHARRYWMERAGNTGRALDAWEAYKRERGADDSREMA